MLVIFDKDGVLLDTEEAKIESYWKAIQEILQLAPEKEELGFEGWSGYKDWHFKNLTGKRRAEVVRGILDSCSPVELMLTNYSGRLYDRLKESDKEAVLDELSSDRFSTLNEKILSGFRMKHYSKMSLEETTCPIERTLELLSVFHNHCVEDLELALITVSESERTLRELKAFEIDFAKFFVLACKDKIIEPVNEMQVAQGGPKEEVYKKIIEMSESEPEETWAIEDTDKGREKALEAGVNCFHVHFPS